MDEIEEFVTNCYKAVLNRAPDKSGFNNYVTLIKNGKILKDDLPSILTSSSEYKIRFKNKYEIYWNPKSLDQAKNIILSSDDSPASQELFNKLGLVEADNLNRLVKNNFTILDYGCGIGRIAKHLSKHVKNIRCVDVSEKMLSFAKEYCKDHSNIKFSLTKDTKIPLADNSIDFIYSVLTLQHLQKEDVILILEEMHRVLKNNCMIYLTFPNLDSDIYWKHFKSYCEDPKTRISSRTRMYTVEEVKINLKRTGFNIIEILSIKSKESNHTKIIDNEIRVLAEKISNH